MADAIGANEVLINREAHLDLWRESGAVDWLKGSSRGPA